MSDASDIYRPPSPPVIASKFCDLCDAWGDHFTDRHVSDDDPEPSPGELVGLLADARKAVKG